jgi:hypothetical protein
MNRLPILIAFVLLSLTPAALAADAKPAKPAAAKPAPAPAPAPGLVPARDMTQGACVMLKSGGRLNCMMTDEATCGMVQGYLSTEYYPGDSCVSRID